MHRGPLSLFSEVTVTSAHIYWSKQVMWSTPKQGVGKCTLPKMQWIQTAWRIGTNYPTDHRWKWTLFFLECLLVAWYCASLLTSVHLKSVKQYHVYSSHYFTSFAACRETEAQRNQVTCLLCTVDLRFQPMSVRMQILWSGGSMMMARSQVYWHPIKSLFPKWPSLFQNFFLFLKILNFMLQYCC